MKNIYVLKNYSSLAVPNGNSRLKEKCLNSNRTWQLSSCKTSTTKDSAAWNSGMGWTELLDAISKGWEAGIDSCSL